MTRSVLVVDDEPLVRELLSDMLRDMGCEVWAASNGAEALQVLGRERRIEMLITDVNMPGMSGHDLAEQARQVRQGLRVLLLSGYESDGHGYPIVRKPFVAYQLRAVMRRTLGIG